MTRFRYKKFDGGFDVLLEGVLMGRVYRRMGWWGNSRNDNLCLSRYKAAKELTK